MSHTVQYDGPTMVNQHAAEWSGEALRDARSQLGWSQRVLARHANITPGYVALIEQGLRMPGTELKVRFDRAFAAFGLTTNFGGGRVSAGRVNPTPDRLAVRSVDFALPIPDDAGWFERTPLTMVVGALGSGKTTYVRRWLSEVSRRSGTRIIWIQLSANSAELQAVEKDVRSQVSDDREQRFPAIPPSSPSALATAIARRVEGGSRTPFLVAFDDWLPAEGGIHDVVIHLASLLQRTPVIAVTEHPRSGLAASVAVQVPQPMDSDWSSWCERAHLPPPLRETFFRVTGRNLLAAAYLKGATFFAATAPTAEALNQAWSQTLQGLPLGTSVAWKELVERCLATVGDAASQILQTSASSSSPIPSEFFGSDSASEIISKLIELRFAEAGPVGLSVHPVMRQFAREPAYDYVRARLDTTNPDPAIVEVLLRLRQFDLGADLMIRLIDEWQLRAEAPAKIIAWAESLPEEVTNRLPRLQLGIARARAYRAASGDLVLASALLDRLLADFETPESLRWKALQQSADIAIRTGQYERAVGYVVRADDLARTSAGVFDRESLDVLRARVAWEQCSFEEAAQQIRESVAPATSHGARRMSWLARSLASLGNYPEASAAARRGREIAKLIESPRSDAYASILLADYELLRGNLGRATRLADRTTEIGHRLGYGSLEIQGLCMGAEILAARGEHHEAGRRLEAAREVITERQEDPWANAYLLVSQSRLARAQPRWPALWSMAQLLEREAFALSSRGPRHPVVGAILVEAAHCWVAAGYAHEAVRVLSDLAPDRCDWRTWWEARLLGAISSVSEGQERVDAIAELLDEAREKGCPYLAATGGYLAASCAVLRVDPTAVAALADWTLDVAAARGWPALASMAAALAPTAPPEKRGATNRVISADGGVTIIAPRRPQHGAAQGPTTLLPDPFDD